MIDSHFFPTNPDFFGIDEFISEEDAKHLDRIKIINFCWKT